MQAENEIPDLFVGAPAVVGDNTQQRLGWYYHYRGRPTKANPFDCSETDAHSFYTTDESEVDDITDYKKTEFSNNVFIEAIPNPSNEQFKILITGVAQGTPIELVIQSSDGRMMYHHKMEYSDGKDIIWNARDAQSGVYYFTIKVNQSETKTCKLFKM